MGKQFTAGDPKELAEGVRRMLADPDGLRRMRANARAYFDDHLTEQHNYTQLLSIYFDVIDKARFQT